jgi:hypothetical protein
MFYACQQIEWLTPSPYSRGLTSWQTCCEIWFKKKKPWMKRKRFKTCTTCFCICCQKTWWIPSKSWVSLEWSAKQSNHIWHTLVVMPMTCMSQCHVFLWLKLRSSQHIHCSHLWHIDNIWTLHALNKPLQKVLTTSHFIGQQRLMHKLWWKNYSLYLWHMQEHGHLVFCKHIVHL